MNLTVSILSGEDQRSASLRRPTTQTLGRRNNLESIKYV